ncbi:MAG: tRNA (adenosine(37)-N6)-threonylcarbamoyltransferase complex transferase subunit TsaD, partial [Sulfurimonas sp.]
SANCYLREQVEAILKPYGAKLLLSELQYCSDNAAMIGRAALEMYEREMFSDVENLHVNAKSTL